MSSTSAPTIGWIGTGRMGYAMVTRLLEAGYKVSVYNRTRAKCEPLAGHGATVVDSIAELAGCDIVFSMVSGSRGSAGEACALQLARKFRACSEAL